MPKIPWEGHEGRLEGLSNKEKGLMDKCGDCGDGRVGGYIKGLDGNGKIQ